MRFPELLAKIQAMPEGSIVFAENRYDYPYLETVINTYRGKWIRMMYAQNKRIHVSCYQKHYPDFNPYAQPANGCFATFPCPMIISLDEHSDGLRYVGTDELVSNKTVNFRRVTSRPALATYNNHPVMRVKNKLWVGYLYDGTEGLINLYGEGITLKNPPLVEAIFANPFEVSTYNKDLHNYPLPDDAIPELEKMIFADNTKVSEATRPTPAFVGNQQFK